jgi:hypothetical protein
VWATVLARDWGAAPSARFLFEFSTAIDVRTSATQSSATKVALESRWGNRYGDRTIGPDYVRKSYPKFDAWLTKRAAFDPDQIFVTDYWRTLLGIS